MNKVEVLSPAGDFECLESAVKFGADAVFLAGTEFGMRTASANFDNEQLKKACDFAHKNNVKVHLTCNTLPRVDEVERLPEFLQIAQDCGVDAFIIADVGVMELAKKYAPKVDLHVSTQAGCVSHEDCLAWHDMGACRVVLARELSLDEIRAIRSRIPDALELEAFIHGSMCVSYSGRCLLSSHLTGRDGNRGMCTQPCRWNYHLMEQKRPGEFFPVVEDEKGMAILSSYDMCAAPFLDKLAEAGVTSFKIEGRMKTPFYVATVVNAYRHAIDGDLPLDVIMRELDSCSHRPYSSAFYFGEMVHSHGNSGAYIQKCKFAGTVLGYEHGIATVEQRNNFRPGDMLEIISPLSTGKKFTVTEIRDEGGNALESAKLIQQVLKIPCEIPLQKGDILRIRTEE